MIPSKLGTYILLGVVLVHVVSAVSSTAESAPNADHTDEAITLQGPWQFHLGDDMKWALPGTHDATGIDGWEQINPDRTWGEQGHWAYAGYAWYRKHIHWVPPDASPDVALLMGGVGDAYEIYWNGRLVGHVGTLPPNPVTFSNDSVHTFGLGALQDGVLALRVWKAPPYSNDSGAGGGLSSAPMIGSPKPIAARKAELDYNWMRSRQFLFELASLNVLVMLLSLLLWLHDHSQSALLWMAAFCGARLGVFFFGIPLPFSSGLMEGCYEPALALRAIALWFLLLELFQLGDRPRLVRYTRWLASINVIAASLNGMLVLFDWSNAALSRRLQTTDAVLTAVVEVLTFYPFVLVVLALRKRLQPTRYLVAIVAFVDQMIRAAGVVLQQGGRFTHWSSGEWILGAPLFTIAGSGFPLPRITDTLLFLTLIYTVSRAVWETTERRNALEQEFRSAREVQHVLIPEALPNILGYSLTSVYRPAREVGGDFFQILPLQDESASSTLILLGDVSGKGLKAAMTVSLIVGTIRTLAETISNPAAMLAGLNRRLEGRLQGGFATCIALRMDANGSCILSSAGHPAPYLNGQEVTLPGNLPLGLSAAASYEEASLCMNVGDHFVLYTDGLLEARSASGEIFSFERLKALFAVRPDAAQAAEAAINFGQDDDITVLTFTRLSVGEESTTHITSPLLSPSPA